MKRRSFFKGLVALVLAPAAALAKTVTPPAKPDPRLVDISIVREPRGLYGWAEHGYAVLDNRRVLSADFGCSDEVSDQNFGSGKQDYQNFSDPLEHGVDEVDFRVGLTGDDEYEALTIPNCKLPTSNVIKGETVVIPFPSDNQWDYDPNDPESHKRLEEALGTLFEKGKLETYEQMMDRLRQELKNVTKDPVFGMGQIGPVDKEMEND